MQKNQIINNLNLLIGLILLLSMVIFSHNILTYPYDGGMDYLRRTTYARIISHEFRFPTYQETSEVYDAPMFYFTSGLIARAIGLITQIQFLDALGLVRFGSATLAIISFWLWYKMFSRFHPKNKLLAVGFILLLTSMPVFYKAGAMYVSELLTLFLTTVTLYFFINRWLKTPDIKNTFLLTLLISIGLLTRISFLSVFLAILTGITTWYWAKKRLILALKPVIMITLLTALATSWFYIGRYQGTLLNVSMNETAAFKEKKLGVNFYLHFPLKVMMKYPFRPVLSEPTYFWPIYYADFWGDYWNYFPQTRFGKGEFFSARANRQTFSPARKQYLSWQSWANLIPTLLMIISFFYLLINRNKLLFTKKVNLKIIAEITFLAIVIFTWTSLLILMTKYKGQGDLIKATYTVFIVPIYAYITTVFISLHLNKIKIVILPVAAVLFFTILNNFIFSWF